MRDYLDLSPTAPGRLHNQGDFAPLTEWLLFADPSVPDGLAWHAWRALSAGLVGPWGRRLLQYVPVLPTYGGYAQVAGGLRPYLAPNRAVLWLTTEQPQGFGTQWCAWHSWDVDADGRPSPYAFQPTAKVPNCGGWMADFDWLTIPLSHELAEMITDPFPGTPTGWDTPDGAENADLCNWQRYGWTAPSVGDWPPRQYGLSRYWCNDLGNCGP